MNGKLKFGRTWKYTEHYCVAMVIILRIKMDANRNVRVLTEKNEVSHSSIFKS